MYYLLASPFFFPSSSVSFLIYEPITVIGVTQTQSFLSSVFLAVRMDTQLVANKLAKLHRRIRYIGALETASDGLVDSADQNFKPHI